MSRIGFIFVAAVLVTFALFSGGNGIQMEYQLAISIGLIALVGVPHGAIDHVLYLKGSKDNNSLRFYIGYLGTLLLYLCLWLLLPRLSLIVFLVVSAFHFGQSQLIEKVHIHNAFKNLLSLSWGASILSGLVVYNHDEIIQLSGRASDLEYLLPVFNVTVHKGVLLVTSFATLASYVLLARFKKLSVENAVFEAYTLGIIHLAFFALPLLLGFTLYFAILHSGKVLHEEFQYLRTTSGTLALPDFIRMLIPYSILSLAGAVAIAVLSYVELLPVSVGMLMLVLISVLTLPHSVVMDVFYNRTVKKS